MGVFKVIGPDSVGENNCISLLGDAQAFNCEQWNDTCELTIGHDIDADEFSTVELVEISRQNKCAGVVADANTAMN